MDSEIEITEQRVKSFIVQLQTECGILGRIVYKNKNQHRRCSYFQYLLKVRRDLRILKSANMEEILNACFLIIIGNRPKQKVQLLESLKRTRCNSDKYNVLERLLGIARLLSQMVEPMVKAAIEISKLLARSFFMGFSVTILAVLARLRVLVQQVFREYYPAKKQATTFLECVWQTDKYVLVERMNTSESKIQEKDIREDVALRSSKILYKNIEALLGVDNPVRMDAEHILEEDPTNAQEMNTSSVNGDEKQGEVASGTLAPSSVNMVPLEEPSTHVEIDCNILSPVKAGKINHERQVESDSDDNFNFSEAALPTCSTAALSSCPVKVNAASKVAFVSIKQPVPVPSMSDRSGFHVKRIKKNDTDKEDSFFNLLTAGNQNNRLF